jgi:hypothetical protein
VNKNGQLIIKPFISKAGDSKNPNPEEFDWRLRFNHAFGAPQPYSFSIIDNTLKIHTEPGTYMLFKKVGT